MAKFRFVNALMTMRILWGALTMSTLLLVVVAFMARQPQRYPMPASQAWMLFGVGAVVAVVSFVLPARLVVAALRQRKRPAVSDGAFTNLDDAVRLATALGQTPFILSMALSEAVSLLGFVVAFLGGPLEVAAVLFASGTLLAASRFPTRTRILGPFERACGATFAASKGSEDLLG
jgi:hypothetical protein